MTKMWIGLYLTLLQIVFYIVLVMNHNTTHLYKLSELLWHNSSIQACFIIRSGYVNFHTNSCVPSNDQIDNIFLTLIIPQLLNGLSSLLVSMTVFEFICAQAPRTTQGLLIGLWYATFSIRYLLVDVLDSYITERRMWLICEGVKGFLILVSLVLFSRLSRHYRYRQRDEIVYVEFWDRLVSVVVIGLIFQIDALAYNEYTTCRDIYVGVTSCGQLDMKSFLNMFHPYPCPHTFSPVSHPYISWKKLICIMFLKYSSDKESTVVETYLNNNANKQCYHWLTKYTYTCKDCMIDAISLYIINTSSYINMPAI